MKRIRDIETFFKLIATAQYHLKGQAQEDFVCDVCANWLKQIKEANKFITTGKLSSDCQKDEKTGEYF